MADHTTFTVAGGYGSASYSHDMLPASLVTDNLHHLIVVESPALTPSHTPAVDNNTSLAGFGDEISPGALQTWSLAWVNVTAQLVEELANAWSVDTS